MAGRDDQPRHRVSRARCGNHRPGARTILCVSTLQKGDGCADHQTLLQTTLACGLSCPRHARVGDYSRSLATRSQRSQSDRDQATRRCKHSSLSAHVGEPIPSRRSRSQAHLRIHDLPIDAGLAKACHCHQVSCGIWRSREDYTISVALLAARARQTRHESFVGDIYLRSHLLVRRRELAGASPPKQTFTVTRGSARAAHIPKGSRTLHGPCSARRSNRGEAALGPEAGTAQAAAFSWRPMSWPGNDPRAAAQTRRGWKEPVPG